MRVCIPLIFYTWDKHDAAKHNKSCSSCKPHLYKHCISSIAKIYMLMIEITSEVMVPILIKIPMANKIPPITNNNVAKPIALQGTMRIVKQRRKS
jgi:hypothetical protein